MRVRSSFYLSQEHTMSRTNATAEDYMAFATFALHPLHLPMSTRAAFKISVPHSSGDRPRCPHRPYPILQKQSVVHSALGTWHPTLGAPGGVQDFGLSKFRGLAPPPSTPIFKNKAWKTLDSTLGARHADRPSYIYDGLYLSGRWNARSDLNWQARH